MRRLSAVFAASLVCFPFSIFAQDAAAKPAPAAPVPDVLVFKNGDQLTGQLISAAGGNLVFKSDVAGQVTVGFDKVKELRSGTKANQFAVIRKGVKVNKALPAPEGTVSVLNGNVEVATGLPAANPESSSAPATVPVAQVDQLVSRKEFDDQFKRRGLFGFFRDWNGTLMGGASLARSTTSATNLTAGIALVRTLPAVSWLPPRNRTTVDVNESYGKNTSPTYIPPQPGVANPQIITLSSIFHADAERDEYLSKRFYALGDLAFDHNYAQGLGLQQIYGGGFGWTVIKDAKQELDLKADLHFERQQFITSQVNGAIITPPVPYPSQDLIGSTIFQGYHRTLPKKMVFTEALNVLPAFNQAKDYSANVMAGLTLPVFKRLSASVSSTDSFLNDPQPGFKKNSFLFVTGVSYALR